jgi:hypothetical protein
MEWALLAFSHPSGREFRTDEKSPEMPMKWALGRWDAQQVEVGGVNSYCHDATAQPVRREVLPGGRFTALVGGASEMGKKK